MMAYNIQNYWLSGLWPIVPNSKYKKPQCFGSQIGFLFQIREETHTLFLRKSLIEVIEVSSF
jgi:hypothetical protein